MARTSGTGLKIGLKIGLKMWLMPGLLPGQQAEPMKR